MKNVYVVIKFHPVFDWWATPKIKIAQFQSHIKSFGLWGHDSLCFEVLTILNVNVVYLSLYNISVLLLFEMSF